MAEHLRVPAFLEHLDTGERTDVLAETSATEAGFTIHRLWTLDGEELPALPARSKLTLEPI